MKKRVVITGGTSGMGSEIVKLYVENGDNIVFTGVEEPELGEKIAKEFGEINSDSKVFYSRCNVADEEEVKELVAFVEEKIGGCDILINNAGIFEGGQVHETTIESWNRVFDVDVKGVFLMSKHFIPGMLERKTGAIVNTSSASGILGDTNMAAYNSAKGAVTNLTRAMALDYARKGIRVNAVCPTATATPMFLNGSTPEVIESFNRSIPLGRVAQPKEVAEAVFYLASNKASFITGVNLPLDGGLSAHSGQPRQDKE